MGASAAGNSGFHTTSPRKCIPPPLKPEASATPPSTRHCTNRGRVRALTPLARSHSEISQSRRAGAAALWYSCWRRVNRLKRQRSKQSRPTDYHFDKELDCPELKQQDAHDTHGISADRDIELSDGYCQDEQSESCSRTSPLESIRQPIR